MMTEDERSKCHIIIHSHAAACAGGNLVPVPGVGIAADLVVMTTMAMTLASVFGGHIPESVAKSMGIAALKNTALKSPIKTLTKELSKIIPFLGQVVASSISVTMVEAAGWALAEELSNMRDNNNNQRALPQ